MKTGCQSRAGNWWTRMLRPFASRAKRVTGASPSWCHCGSLSFLVSLPCQDDRACVDGGAVGLDRVSYFEFASEQVAHRVAAAFRHVTSLCQREEDAAQAEGRFVEVPEAPATIQ